MPIQKIKAGPKWYATLARVLFFYICSVIIFAFSAGITKGISSQIADHTSMLLSTALTFALVFVFTRWEKLNLRDVGVIPGKKSIPRFIIGYLTGLSMAITQALVVLVVGHFRLVFVPQITISQVLLSFLLYILIASREELVFRSYSLRSLNYALGWALALAIITTIFILEHIIAGMLWGTAILGIGMGGVLFGLAAIKTKGLALPLGLHSAWNFGQWSLGFKGKPGMWEAITEKGYESQVQTVGLAAFVLVMAVAIGGICFFYRKERP